MKNTLLIIFLLFCTSLQAQEMSVKSFHEVSNDLSARTKPRQDLNGNDCALVKVLFSVSGASFAGMVVGDINTYPGEYWVYMAQGSKRLTIRLEGCLPLEVEFNDYGVSKLEAKTVYLLTLADINSSTTERTQGYIFIDSNPQGGTVFINEKHIGITPLTNYKCEYGTYKYRIEHPDCKPFEGIINLNSNRSENMIPLEPYYGTLTINCQPKGTKIIIDGQSKGKSPTTIKKMSAGEHSIILSKDEYNSKKMYVRIAPNQTEVIDVVLNRGAHIHLNEGDWLMDKINDCSGPFDSLVISGNFDPVDWGSLAEFCKSHSVKLLDMSQASNGGDLPHYCDFQEDTSLIEVHLPELKSIGGEAFKGCKSLKKISMQGDCESIHFNAFEDCVQLESVIMPNRVKIIRDKAFAGCVSLQTIILPNGLTWLASDVFKDCSSLISVIAVH